jgi:hypothetical protein
MPLSFFLSPFKDVSQMLMLHRKKDDCGRQTEKSNTVLPGRTEKNQEEYGSGYFTLNMRLPK